MDTGVVGKENCVERRIDDFGDAINGDQEEGTAEWSALRNTIFLVVGEGVVTGCSDTKGAFLEVILEWEGEWTTEAKLVKDGADVISPYSRKSIFHVKED